MKAADNPHNSKKMKLKHRRPSRAGGGTGGGGRTPAARVTTPAQPQRRPAADVYSDDSADFSDAPEDKPGASRRFDVRV